MVKKIGNVLTVLNVSLLVLALLASFGAVHASTEVNGTVAVHTTWTKANSPYDLTGPIVIPQGAILTIEAGVTVNLNSYYILVNGTLDARGNSSSSIHINGGGNGVDNNGNTIYPITFTPLSNDWNEQVGVGCIIEHTVLDSSSLFIVSSPKICNNTFKNSHIKVTSTWIGSGATWYSSSPVISDNLLNGTGDFGIQTFYSSGTISKNTISGFSTGIELQSATSTVVQGNYITENTDGIKLVVHQAPVSVQIKENTITSNENGISLVRQVTAVNSPSIHENNIYSNLNYNIKLSVPDNVDATYNWWGTTELSVIDELINDNADDSTLGTVNYVPVLITPNLNAPEAPKEPEPLPEPTPTQLSISVDTTSTGVGTSVNVNGKLQNSTSGSPLQNQRVTLSYSFDGATWNSIGSENTTESGDYTIQWSDIETGTFTLRIDFAGNDNYLATNATTSFSCLPHQETQKAFFIESNSTITLLTFNNKETEINFFAEGPSGTTGYVNATIPKDLLDSTEDWTVLVDNQKITPTIIDDDNNTYIYFLYGHSIKTINIIGTTAIPEFSSLLILPLFAVAAFLVVLGKQRMLKTKNQQSY